MRYVLLVTLLISSGVFSYEFENVLKLAEQGDAEAQVNLGHMYLHGEGVPQNGIEAIKWYRKAAEQGEAWAQTILGTSYHMGNGVPENHTEALKWYLKAAKQGNVLAQYSAGYLYDFGDGVTNNDAEAVRWYRKAAEQGEANAQLKLGYKYSEGKGVRKDDIEAIKWYRKSAEQGVALAQICLAQGYKRQADILDRIGLLVGVHEENGSRERQIEAYVWASMGATQGMETGKKLLREFKEIMTQEEIAKGQELASKCWQSNFKDCD